MQCLNLTFRCTRGTFSVQTWHGLVKQLRCSDGTGNVLRLLIHKLDLDHAETVNLSSLDFSLLVEI